MKRIVTAKPPKRSPPRKPPRPQAAMPVRVVTAKKPKGPFVRKLSEVEPDAESEARVAAFFKRMIVPRS